MDSEGYTTAKEPILPASSNDKPIATTSSILMTQCHAHGSAPFLGTFLVIHLWVPITGNVSGSGLASSTMLLGRDYYRTAFWNDNCSSYPSLSTLPRVQPNSYLPKRNLLHGPQATSTWTLGSSELDPEFVKTAIRTWQGRSWMLYTGLVGCLLVHTAEDGSVI
ncbi:hypothetical protein EDC04DRAFT_2608144 [Pisolithus marmoratus]|nr:hypothetical protein EDC04DRAFT_2608144 [Pisolithus marmoratus]